jgi:hypothetical protein
MRIQFPQRYCSRNVGPIGLPSQHSKGATPKFKMAPFGFESGPFCQHGQILLTICTYRRRIGSLRPDNVERTAPTSQQHHGRGRFSFGKMRRHPFALPTMSLFRLWEGRRLNGALPATLPLFATGLGAIGLLGWRRKRENAAAIATA